MQNIPLISVVLPVHNGEEFLAKSIQSIINQTYKNWELIIVDDCSMDNSNKIAQEFANSDNRIKIIKNEKNLKLPASLNVGFDCAKGKYYTWTSDDNEYYPDAFEKMVDFLENNSYYGMVYAQTNVEKDGVIQDYIWCDGATTPATLLSLCVPGACFMYRKTVAQKVGRYNEDCFLNEDHEYWLRVLLVTHIANLDEVLYLYRLRKRSLTEIRKKEINLGKFKLLKKYRKIYAETFNCIKENFKAELTADALADSDMGIEDAKKAVSVEILYKVLKKDYLYSKEALYLNLIKSLGIKYCLKALLLELKTRKGAR